METFDQSPDISLPVMNTAISEPKPRIQSACRTISILLAVANSPNGLKAKDIMQKLGLSRQVAYHLIHTMHGTGIIRKDERNRYVLGLAAISIAEGFGRQLSAPQFLSQRVASVVAATGETAYAVGWVGDEIVALTSAPGSSPVGATQIPLGSSVDAHAWAAGKVLLAFVDNAQCESFLANHPFQARTKNTLVDHDAFMENLEGIRNRGYAIDNEEFAEGLKCVAVPMEGLGSKYSLGISVPKYRFDENFEQYLSILVDAARLTT
jgi:IclR family acetate operon transcriptional repressor